MHDPKTVAHELRIFGRPIVTVWHVDPETDGTDDSCGWFSPQLIDKEKHIIDDVINWERDFPFYSSQAVPNMSVIEDVKYDYFKQGVGDCIGYIAAAWKHIAWHRDGRRKLTNDELWKVVNLAANPQDNLRAILSDPEQDPLHRAKGFLYCVMRAYCRHHRPWWRHPRWHIRHWSFQIHFIQTLKRWLFSRCADCNKQFSWGYSPISTKWEGTGPSWFKRESGVYHHECYPGRPTPAGLDAIGEEA